ncbi:regulatory protein RecX [Candidatus Aerophobetes bacterium]|nr:regulatory protein RecX [Candidatus Aerophobetes bacterium]
MKKIGIITTITPQKNNPNRFSLFVDGKFISGISYEAIKEANLYVGKELKDKDLKQIYYKEKVNKARMFALKLLSYRERSKWEIKKRMEIKGYQKEIIEDTLNYLKKRNLINDKRFARMWIEDRIRSGYGRRRIYYELSEKGVDKEIVGDLIKKLYPEVNEINIALHLLAKNKRFLKEEKNLRIRKISAFLERRGFPFNVINEVIEKRAEIVNNVS